MPVSDTLMGIQNSLQASTMLRQHACAHAAALAVLGVSEQNHKMEDFRRQSDTAGTSCGPLLERAKSAEKRARGLPPRSGPRHLRAEG